MMLCIQVSTLAVTMLSGTSGLTMPGLDITKDLDQSSLTLVAMGHPVTEKLTLETLLWQLYLLCYALCYMTSSTSS